MNISSEKKGFTLVELLVVIGILAVIFAISAPYFSTTMVSNDAKASALDAGDALREAQSSAMSGYNGGKFGVHFETSKFVFFQGDAYATTDANNKVHAMSGEVAISWPGGAPSLNIKFANSRGTPDWSGTVTFTTTGSTATVTVNSAGMIDP